MAASARVVVAADIKAHSGSADEVLILFVIECVGRFRDGAAPDATLYNSNYKKTRDN